jgi:hypothetical protein
MGPQFPQAISPQLPEISALTLHAKQGAQIAQMPMRRFVNPMDALQSILQIRYVQSFLQSRQSKLVAPWHTKERGG